MLPLSTDHITTTLPLPYRRGAETESLVLAPDGAGWARLKAYDFSEYRARHGEAPPDPRYVLIVRTATGLDRLDVEVEFGHPTRLADSIDASDTAMPVAPGLPHAPPFTVVVGEETMRVTGVAGATWTVNRGTAGTRASAHARGAQAWVLARTTTSVPPHTATGRSVALPLPPHATTRTRLRRIRTAGRHPAHPPHAQWGVVALLGSLAKLAWVLGDEKESIRAHLRDVARQRSLASAHGFGLDLMGRDLRVPRFPPRPHSFDPETIALYHADAPEGTAALTDETERFGRPGHPGVVHGAVLGAPGAFGGGLRLPGPTGRGRVDVAADPALNVGATDSFTAEAFVRPDPHDAPAVILLRGPLDADGTLTGAGYALLLESTRGFQNNLRWTVRDDAGTTHSLFADLDLADGTFHHVGGVIDRERGELRLHVDGTKRSRVDARTLGALSPAAPLRIGRRSDAPGSATDAQHQFRGTIDEIRLSRAARRWFDPVLGESDVAYRRRLDVFERWLVPSPVGLLDAINELVPIEGDSKAFVLLEADRDGAHATRDLRVVPRTVPPGSHLDASGDTSTREADAVAPADAQPVLLRGGADSDFLVPVERSGVVVSSTTVNRVQLGVRRRIDALADRLADAGDGTLRILRAFDASVDDLHRVGRAVRLTHDAVPLDRLAALAHQVGFAYVAHESASVYASIDADPLVDLTITHGEVPDAYLGVTVFTGGSLGLAIVPTLPAGRRVEWSIVSCGPGRARFDPSPTPNDTTATLRAEAPGAVVVRVAVTVGTVRVVGTRTVRIGPEVRPDGAIGADGTLSPPLSQAVGATVAPVAPAYRVAANIDVDGPAALGRVHLAFRTALDRLRSSSRVDGLVLRDPDAFDPPVDAAPRETLDALHAAGRARYVFSPSLDVEVLAALAHAARFDYVLPTGEGVLCAVADGPLLDVVARTSDGLVPLDDTLETDRPVVVTVRQAEALEGGDVFWSLFPHSLGRLTGAAPVLAPGADAPSGSAKTLAPTAPGPVTLTALYYEDATDGTLPYSVELRLKDALDVPETVIPKDSYDLIMNVLNSFHPIGVEIITTNIRAHVRELVGDAQGLLPDYTFPDYRL